MGKSRPWSISVSANQIRGFGTNVVPSPSETEPYNKVGYNYCYYNMLLVYLQYYTIMKKLLNADWLRAVVFKRSVSLCSTNCTS